MSREMKQSGVPWIGEIPKTWEIRKVKDVFVRKNEKAHQDNPVILSLARAGVKVRDVSTNEGQMAESYYDYNPVEPFDLLVNPMDLYSGANCSMSLVSGVISPAYVNLRAKGGACSRFYDYYFKTQYWSMAFFAHGKGISFDNRWTLGVDTLFRYNVPFPSVLEQQKIASFLDRKCSEIDEMIALQEKIVEELKAYKQSVITEAVTKGLNPDVPMKDSEVVFYGRIPQHWKETKTLRLLEMPITDGPHETPENVDDGIPFISADAVSDGYINFDNKWGLISKEYYLECCKKYTPQRGDIYMIKSGASTGRTVIVETDEIFTIWSPLAVFRANRGMILPYYLLYILKSNGYLKQVENKWTYGTQQNIGMRTLEKLIICYPELDEQKEIVSYLDNKCAKIDNLISIKLSKIDSLKEYKKSIIYEYVTGKKEVE